jgi:hypothetical protein
MPEEHVGQLGFEYAWKDLLTRARDAGTFLNAFDEKKKALTAFPY